MMPGANAAAQYSSAQEVKLNETKQPIVDAKHTGVASCAASTCHGSTVLYADSNILQNEFRTWNERDPHARAYQTLLSDESKHIAIKLGLPAAETADLCLGCHTDNVPVAQHGEEFDIADGVGCEACHGGAENYLESHTDATHEENLSTGLRKTENPTVRAKLCLSCHLGNDSDRKITHKIMGAGHPRLSFELNTFSSIQPAHYVVDDDYVTRKGVHDELQLWAIGQIVATEQLLSNIDKFPRSGLFPELVHMDCLGCHQPMNKIEWQPNPLTKLPAGALRYNDAHMLMSYQLAKTISMELANEMLINIQGLLDSQVSPKKTSAAISKLQYNVVTLRDSLERTPLTQAQGNSILDALISNALSADHQGYASAEQSAMAINSVARVMRSTSMSTVDKKSLLDGIDKMFDAVNDAETFKANGFIAGVRAIRASLK
jgi:hypothetical protein